MHNSFSPYKDIITRRLITTYHFHFQGPYPEPKFASIFIGDKPTLKLFVHIITSLTGFFNINDTTI